MASAPPRLVEALAERYRLERELGVGGMATVYLAHDVRHHRSVAIKVLDPSLARTLGPERFQREIELVAALHHPHIMPLHDSGSAAGHLYYVMPLAEGETLRDRLKREIQLPSDDAIRIAREVLDALAYAHDHHVVHRDVKPENILLEGGHAILTDFGIARPDDAVGDTLTRTGVILGTAAYMSPEQISGVSGVDARTDQYGLACVLFEMLAGQPPFVGATGDSLAYQHLSAPPPPVTRLRPTVSAAVSAVIERALAKSPADRFTTAGDMSRALEAASQTAGAGITGLRLRRPRGRWLVAAAGIALLVAVAALMTGDRFGCGQSTIRSIAVLPMVNESGDASQEFFVDGMTGELIDQLARIGSLRVVSRTSSMTFKDAHLPLPVIAGRLGVDALVEGSVARTGDRVRILAELVQAHPERSLWGERYERDLRDVITLQAEVAGAIAGRVEAALTPEERARLSASRPVNPAAHEEYLRGRYAVSRFELNAFKEALGHFQAATRIDSNDAASWAGVAEAYYMLSNLLLRPDVAMPQVRAAAEHAIRLDPDLDDAHTWLATVFSQYDWDWAAGEREFQRAIALNPNSAPAHLGYAIQLQECARPDESIREGERARELDPLSGVAAAYSSWSYYCAGRFSDALDRYRHIVAEDSTNAGARDGIGLCLVEMGLTSEGISELEQVVPGAQNGYPIACLGYAYARGGRVADAQRALAQLSHPPAGLYVSPLWSAYVYSALGDRDRAFECIGRSFEHHEEELGWLKVDPRLRDLRTDPRFASALRRLHLAT